MVQVLLDKKARVNAADKKGDTCLHIAMRARSKVCLSTHPRLTYGNYDLIFGYTYVCACK